MYLVTLVVCCCSADGGFDGTVWTLWYHNYWIHDAKEHKLQRLWAVSIVWNNINNISGRPGLERVPGEIFSLVVVANEALIMARSTASCLEFSRCLSFLFFRFGRLVCSNDSYIVDRIAVLSGQWPLSLIWSFRMSDWWYWDNSGSIPACKANK